MKGVIASMALMLQPNDGLVDGILIELGSTSVIDGALHLF